MGDQPLNMGDMGGLDEMVGAGKVTHLPTRHAKGVLRHQPPTTYVQSPPTLIPLKPWERTGMVDIEVLLAWAFNDQRIAGDPAAGLHQIEAQADGYSWQGHSADGCYVVERIAKVGCRIDISPGSKSAAFHPAAEAVARAVAASPEAVLVEEYACLGVRPSGWREPERWIIPCQWKDGEAGTNAEWVWRGPRRSNPFCPVMVSTSPDAIAAARARYIAWYDALVDLSFALAARALGFVILPPTFDREPWAAQ